MWRLTAADRAGLSSRRSFTVVLAAVISVWLGLGVLPAPPAAAAPLPLSAAEGSSAAVTSPAAGRTDLFSRSSTGRLVQQYRPAGGSWTRTLDRAGSIASQPAAVSWGPGRIDVFARGADGALWHRWSTSDRWSAWESLGGRLTSAPGVASWTEGRLDVVARGADNTVLHRRYTTAAGWSGWRSLGGTVTSSPAIASTGPGQLDVVARGTDNAIWHKSYRSGAGWSRWGSLGGRATSQPALAAPAPGHLDVLVRGTDDAVWSRTFAAGAWGPWQSRGGTFASGPGASNSAGTVRVVARSANGGLSEVTRPGVTRPWGTWRRVDPLLPFRRLGTWVKIWDYPTVDPVTAVADMKARGVRVLYLQTGRFTSSGDFHDPVKAGTWLDAAHGAGIKVVGWYVPGYGDMARDVRRTVAIANFVSPGGQRFDATGVDIEYYGTSGEVSRPDFYARIAPHLDRVRRQSPAIVGAIVPPPFATQPGTHWAGFPWEVIGPRSEVVVPMVMWSNRVGYTPAQIRTWARDEVTRTRSLTGRPVMAEGGIGTPTTTDVLQRVDAFVRGTSEARAIGGAHWDYTTTDARFWPILARLNEL